MDKAEIPKKQNTKGESLIHFDSVNTVNEILAKATDYCAAKKGINKADVPGLLEKGDAGAYGYFNHSIASQIGEVLGKVCDNVKAVYALNYEDNIQEDGPGKSDPTIHVILRVERKTNAVNALVEALNKGLTQKYRQMLGKDTLKNILNAYPVDKEDIKNRAGYGALLGSIYQPPIHVWGDKLSHI